MMQNNLLSTEEPAYLAGLNPEQKRAVLTTEGPVLILAGAGTGKTRVLTTRIAHILSLRLALPQQILAVTFTNKAAAEMKKRIGELVGNVMNAMPWLGTFHSIGAKFLRNHAELVSLNSRFTILDTDDTIRLLKQLIREAGIDEKRWPPRNLAALIDGWKNRALSPEQITEADHLSFGDGHGRTLYRAYQKRLQELNVCDFGDLLLHMIHILKSHPDLLHSYQQKFRYMLVDEYQDTNSAQYLWLRLLARLPAKQPVNLCCVGDDDQSIYGWRGAEISNILRFEQDFPGATLIRLECNYRSTSHILATASQLIAHNESRLGKVLFTQQPENTARKVQLHTSRDSEEEARLIAGEIERLHQLGHDFNDTAILVRASFQIRSFEDCFIAMGLPYRVIGGPRFYERLEIRDALAYLHLVAQERHDLAFERIVNMPKRGLGDITLRHIRNFAQESSCSLLQASEELLNQNRFKPKVRTQLSEFIKNIHLWHQLIHRLSPANLAEKILHDSGYVAMWKNDRSPEAPGRLENLKEFIHSMEEFTTLDDFLEHVSLIMDVEQNKSSDAITLMTLHSAKGLEFNTVFLPGWEEGLFPHQRALEESGLSGLEEERRLAYVGITRARKNLYICFASNRRIHGLWQSAIPSRFLQEIPEAHIETTPHIAPEYSSKQNFSSLPNFHSLPLSTPYQNRSQYSDPTFSSYSSPSYRTTAELDQKFRIGERVFHLKFGNGTIMQISGQKFIIQFDKAGEKNILEQFIKKLDQL